MMSSPFFTVIEGIDGSGKTTVIAKMKEFMESYGRKVKITAEPTKSAIGDLVASSDSLPPEAEALLFTADRACHTKDIIQWMDDGFDVISDRYYASTLAYQSASGMDYEWLYAVNSGVIRKPDVHILLDIDPEVSLERVNKRGESISRFEHLEYLKKVREVYIRTAERFDLTVIDASRPQNEVLDDIISLIKERM